MTQSEKETYFVTWEQLELVNSYPRPTLSTRDRILDDYARLKNAVDRAEESVLRVREVE